MSAGELIIRGGTLYDGTGRAAAEVDLLIRGGRVVAHVPPGTPSSAEEIDARGCWVMPGFVDLHTHYDAEVEIAPALSESLRHGITTCVLGSCGLSMAMGSPEDLADMFCRVEGIPRKQVLALLSARKDWDDPASYAEHLGRLALGPNLALLLGHSTLRARAMGLTRSVTAGVRPTEAELSDMERNLEDALDAGYIGLSVNTLPWDKLDGSRHRSQPTPSVFASWAEISRLSQVLRGRGRVLQGVPNLRTKINSVRFLWESVGVFRRALKTSIIALIDAKAARYSFRLLALLARLANRALGADFRVQALPHEFDIYSDGLEVPVLEEIAAGTEALHIEDPEQRKALLQDPGFRARFKRQWLSRLFGRAYHRDLFEARIVGAPDANIIGRSFGEVARERNSHPVDTFLDLMAEHGNALRWHSVIGNDRPKWLRWILQRPDILVGFSDAGAHLRNMAFYNFPLRMLKLVRDASLDGDAFLPLEQAVRRLTSEIADWLGIEAGRLTVGSRADVVVVDPGRLDRSLERVHETDMPGFPGLKRLVRPDGGAVRCVLVAGRVAVQNGMVTKPEDARFGCLLRAETSRSNLVQHK